MAVSSRFLISTGSVPVIKNVVSRSLSGFLGFQDLN